MYCITVYNYVCSGSYIETCCMTDIKRSFSQSPPTANVLILVDTHTHTSDLCYKSDRQAEATSIQLLQTKYKRNSMQF